MKNRFNIRQIMSLILAITMFTACGQTKEERAQEEISKIMESTGAVGLAVAVVKDGEIIYSATFGKKSLEEGTAISQDDIFRIASISKSFTTTALMTLVEQGKLDIDMDVSDLVGFKVRNPKYPEVVITLKKLLSHTSGMNDTQGYFRLDVLNPEKNPDYGKCYNDYEPGTKYEYCNLGFNTIGAIVEKYAGVRFDNYIADKILKPLSLTANFNVDSLDASKFVTLYNKEAVDTTEGAEKIFIPQPAAYLSRAKDIDSGYVMGYSTPLFSPTGGMKISAHDLARYMVMHMNYGVVPSTGVRVLSEESAKLMQSPVVETSEGEFYCLALRTTNRLIPGETMVGHTGSAYGLYSAMFFEPEKRFGFVMMTNGCPPEYKDGFTVIQGDVIRALYEVFIKK
jgi:CubicO group peptidase (beta-lactamase class C family)